MKNKLSITIVLLCMFILTQAIGLFVVNYYTDITLPYGLEVAEDEVAPNFFSLVFSFIIAIAIIFFLMKYKWKFVLKIWFFSVVTLALAISINAFFGLSGITSVSIYAMAVALPLAALKIFKPNFYTHNLSELLIYPGIACVFVPILTPASSVTLLLLISLYDMWAVWRSGIMQKMAKFQMEEIKIFGGFLVPSVSEKIKNEMKNTKQKYKGKKIPESVKNKKYKVNLAMLGGGDVIFPIIVSGVFMRAYDIVPALFVLGGSLAGLSYLFFNTEKGKSYPAMPYISSGIFLGIFVWKILTMFSVL